MGFAGVRRDVSRRTQSGVRGGRRDGSQKHRAQVIAFTSIRGNSGTFTATR